MSFEEQVVEMRSRIDEIDQQLLRLLADRFECCLAVGRLKKKFNVSVMQPSRVHEVTERAAQGGVALGMSPDFGRQMWHLIIDEACRLETEDSGLT